MNKDAFILKLKLKIVESDLEIINKQVNKQDEIVNKQDDIIVNTSNKIDLQNMEGLEFLQSIKDNSIDLVLTDPPYITSRKTGMDSHAKLVNNVDKTGKNSKTEEDWKKYKLGHSIKSDKKKNNYIKYGTIYGKKYAVKTDYGDWDKNFTIEVLEDFIKQYYIKLRDGGSIIIWFDLWKITPLKELLEKYGFKSIRFIEWVKTNPQPLNSSHSYLTNCREIALFAVKKAKPTFNSKYDNAIYKYPLQGGKNRFHPTQKSLKLFIDLINKHSNEGDTILDTFSGAGTTAMACKLTKRKFFGCELEKEYYDKSIVILDNII